MRATRSRRLLAVVAALLAGGALALQAHGEQPVWTGIVYHDDTDGVRITFVMHGSPADIAGVDTGLVVETIDSKPVPGAEGLHSYLKTLGDGQKIVLGVRDMAGNKRSIEITAGRRDPTALVKTALRDGAKALAKRAAPSGEGWTRHQGPQGPEDLGSGLSALAVRALAELPTEELRKPHEALIDKTLATLRKRAEGTYWITDESSLAGQSYETHATAETLLALVARRGPKDPDVAYLASGLLARQLGRKDGPYGGWFTDLDWQTGGFPFEDRPIMRRTDMRVTVAVAVVALEALHAAGFGKDHSSMLLARHYLDRVQNYDEEPDVMLKNLVDGGFPESGIISKAGPKDVGDRRIHRSYGSATADGLAALIYSGADEARIKAAKDWVRNHFELSRTPGFVPDPAAPRARNPFEQGIRFYYVASLARALDLIGEEPFLTPQGSRAWPSEILNTLIADQRRDGAWKNFMTVMDEDNEVIATSFAMLALERIYPHLAKN